MPSSRNVLWLAVDDAVVTLGAQFREVALGLLITALSPKSSSYAWYFLAGSVPGLLLARTYAWASQRFGARSMMIATYGARLVLVLGLWRVKNFWAALILLLGISAGRGFYAAVQAHYVAAGGDFAGVRRVVVRLRQSESAMRLIGPMIAGLVLTAVGYRGGFLLAAGGYAIAMLAVSRLSPIAQKHQKTPPAAMDWRPDGPAIAMFALAFLTWQANTLALAYTFHVLHRHSFGYGLTLSVWGGSGLLAGVLLSRVHVRPMRWMPPLFLLLGLTWLILSLGVSFPVFVVLGGVEGVANWMVQDLAAALILSQAPAGQAGRATARVGAFAQAGAIAGTVSILLVPPSLLVLPLYAVLGILAVSAAGTWYVVNWGMHRRDRQGFPKPPPAEDL